MGYKTHTPTRTKIKPSTSPYLTIPKDFHKKLNFRRTNQTSPPKVLQKNGLSGPPPTMQTQLPQTHH
jgi:hypothetical protein